MRFGFLVAMLVARTASADPETEAAQLFEQGRVLAKDGNYADACEKFAMSFELDRALGTELNLADCHEHLGHWADAWRRFDHAASRAEDEGDRARAEFARERARALVKAHLSTVIVELGHHDDATITIAGKDVKPAQTIERHPEPGPIEIEVDVPGKPTFRWHKHVAVGETVTVTPTWYEPAPAETPAPPSSHAKLWQTVAIAGVAGFVASGALWYYGYSKIEPFDRRQLSLYMPDGTYYPPGTRFDSDQCDTPLGQEARSVQQLNNQLYDQACTGRAITRVAIPLTVTFLVVAVGGFVMVHRQHHDSAHKVAIAPVLAPGTAGVTLALPW